MTTETTPVIQMRDVTKIYRIGTQPLYALNKANLTIQSGEFVSIVGPSGSGKSTLMNIMGCLDVANEGEYLLDGVSVSNYTEKQLTAIRNHKIGFIFQGFNLLGKLTAEQNVELPLIYQRLTAAQRKERVREALRLVGLEERILHKPNELSGGQQQRVAIARALATRPSLLLADEPTGNLDSKTGEDIIALFHQLHDAGNTIVLITHNADIAGRADRRICIIDGHVSEASEG